MSWEALFHTKEEMDREWEKMLARTKWGRWTIDKTTPPSLDIFPDTPRNSTLYQVPLFGRGCGFSEYLGWLGQWTQHLQEKSWISPQDLWDFVAASQDIRRGSK
jgi:hypothetical protein